MFNFARYGCHFLHFLQFGDFSTQQKTTPGCPLKKEHGERESKKKNGEKSKERSKKRMKAGRWGKERQNVGKHDGERLGFFGGKSAF